MTFKAMIEGLQIFAKYEARGLEAHLTGADHDLIWAVPAKVDEDLSERDEDDDGPDDSRFSKEDNDRLRELGWFIDTYDYIWTHYC